MASPTIHSAIATVLRKSKKSLSARDIYEAIIADGLYSFRATQPLQVVSAQLRRRCTNLHFPTANKKKLFSLLPGGLYCLASSVGSAVADADVAKDDFGELRGLHDAHIIRVKRDILAQLKGLSPAQFERLSRHLLIAYGFQDVIVTRLSRDGGIDGHGQLPVGMAHLKVAFQSKNSTATVGRPEVDRFRGAIQGRFEQGVMLTTSTFSNEAQRSSFVPGAVPIVLLDGMEIAKIILDKKLGVTIEFLPLHVFSIDILLDDSPT
jgi:restriction system protein